jgi:phosphoserine phosphatase
VRDRLETVLKNINQAFAEDLTSERFATFVAAVCEEGSDHWNSSPPVTHRFSCTPQPTNRSGFWTRRRFPGNPPDLWDAVPVKLSMQPGDIVLLVTDGFLEWENSAGEDFGTNGSPQR